MSNGSLNGSPQIDSPELFSEVSSPSTLAALSTLPKIKDESSKPLLEIVDEDMPEDQPPASCWLLFKQEASHIKWRLLISMCLMTFGQYYIYDLPGSIGTGVKDTIQAKFQERGKVYNQEMNQVLYSVYSYPNTVLTILGGLLIDKYLGIRLASLLFISLILFGAVLFYGAVYLVSYPLMVLARLVFALGAESNTVSQAAFISRYFSGGNGVSFAFGICVSFSRIGSSFSYMFSPMFALYYGVNTACLAGIFAVIISFISVVVMLILDRRSEKRGIVTTIKKEEQFHFKDILHLPMSIWIVCGIIVASYSTVFPFTSIAKNFFQVKFNISGDLAAKYVSIILYGSAVFGPITGIIVHKIGRYPLWSIGSCFFFTLAHLLALTTQTPPYVITIMMGIPMSVLASGLWPIISLVAEPNIVGFCFGFLIATMNAGLATWPVITGAILDMYTSSDKDAGGNSNVTTFLNNTTLVPLPTNHTGVNLPSMQGFTYAEIFLMATAISGILFSIVLMINDRLNDNILMSSPDKRTQLMKERDERRRLKKNQS